MNSKRCTWHKTAVIYEIYPASFTKDGLQGVISKLDYIKELGVEAIWLCPIFKSPFLDSGYDTEDYYKVNKNFGSMKDMEELIASAHKIGLKLILDIALNHTSHKHPWFIDACKDKKSQYRDYYIFRDGDGNQLPNNWISSKTHQSVWTYNKETNDYYLHIYTKYQPDLNWENANLRQEIVNILDFWLEKGIDGFRLDVINKIAKPRPIVGTSSQEKYSDYLYENHKTSHHYIKELREKVFNKYKNVLMMGQTSGVSLKQGIQYSCIKNAELDLFLQFEHMDLNPMNKIGLQKALLRWQNIDESGSWPTVFMGSHDSSRMINHFATNNSKYYIHAAKMLCVLQLCLKGTQIIYMGDELGLVNVSNTSINEFIDIRSKDMYKSKLREGKDEKQIIDELNEITRDNARRQLPWTDVEAYLNDHNSVLSFYKKILYWRKSEKTILKGDTISLFEDDPFVFSYKRVYEDEEVKIVANLSEKEVQLEYSCKGQLVMSNYDINSLGVLFPFQVKIFKKKV